MDECIKQRKLLASEFQNYRRVFIALGDETRQQIFAVLLQNETIGMRVPEITKCTHLSRPAVSHHLQVLKDAGLIGMHRAGTMNYYYADADSGCWSGLKALVDHVNEVAASARKNGYPGLKEDEQP
jgi:DNA-binding transcriptional ArsR family regulator